MRYDTVFLDLDGTITASGTGIINAFQYALRKEGLEVPSAAALSYVIGPPLLESFQAFMGGSREGAMRCVVSYREYYEAGGMFENSVYPGIPESLERLKSAGYKICLATAKPQVYAARILEHFGLTGFFDLIGGADLIGPKHDKFDVLRDTLAESGSQASRSLMVGDRKGDVDAALALKLDCIGVLYGYGQAEELREAKYICKTGKELADIILSAKS